MKKIILSFAAICMALSSYGQGLYDAYRISQTNYTGTAYTTSLANAVTALGGELGTIEINPAGSAVAGYSQFVFTPGLSMSATSSSLAYGKDAQAGMYSGMLNNRRFQIPSVGISIRYDNEDQYSSLKAVAFGMLFTQISDFSNSSTGLGTTDQTSKFAEMAASSTGILESSFADNWAYGNSELNKYWDAVLGYKLGQISAFGNQNQYVGCTELLTYNEATGTYSHSIPGTLNQRVQTTQIGTSDDLVINMGLDYDHKLYLGFTLGIPIQEYENIETTREIAAVPDLFPVKFTYSDGGEVNTNFDNALYQYNYSYSSAGIYAKVGMIYVLDNGLRLGAAFQTPTLHTVTERWSHSANVTYTNTQMYSGMSDTGEYTYDFTSPSELNLGVAYTFSHFGLISVDYEMMNYGRIRFSEVDFADTFDFTNTAMQLFSGASHSLRIGGEFNLSPAFSLRAGYSITTSPEMFAYDNSNNLVTYSDYIATSDYYMERAFLSDFTHFSESLQSASVGFGYKSKGSLYCDFALKATVRPDSVFSPYGDYSNWQFNDSVGDFVSVQDFYAPKLFTRNTLFNALLTIGWRF